MTADAGGGRGDPTTLFDWDPGEQIPFEYYQSMIAHTRFPAAARALAVSSVETAQGDPVMRDICKDAGRYVAGLGMIWLDLTGGLTSPRLKQMCARSRVLSTGRARNFLQYMHQVGYLEMVRPARAATPAVFTPSSRFRAAWLQHLRGPVAAAAMIAPEAGPLIERLDDPAVCATFLRLQGAALFESTVEVGLDGPVIDAFYYPLAGVQVLSMLIAGGDDHSFPSRTPVPLAVNPIARQLGVSRMHLKRLLRHAEATQLLCAHTGGAYALQEAADAQLRFIYAAQLICLLIPIGRTLRLHGARTDNDAPQLKMFNCDA